MTAAPASQDDPIAFSTGHVLAWVAGTLPPGAHRLLEVGCGRGALAAGLLARGHDVVAIDRAPDAVVAARARGVPAVEADFATFEAAPFDAVLFTRSLHHLEPLAAALERARSLLVTGGAVLLDEFAWERADAATARWFHDERARLRAGGMLADGPQAEDLGATLESWRAHYLDHGVHTGAAMREAVGATFRLGTESAVPYLYRWLADRLAPDAAGAAEVRALFTREGEAIAAGALNAIGLRIAAVSAPR